jgi:hypothetical protein
MYNPWGLAWPGVSGALCVAKHHPVILSNRQKYFKYKIALGVADSSRKTHETTQPIWESFMRFTKTATFRKKNRDCEVENGFSTYARGVPA